LSATASVTVARTLRALEIALMLILLLCVRGTFDLGQFSLRNLIFRILQLYMITVGFTINFVENEDEFCGSKMEGLVRLVSCR